MSNPGTDNGLWEMADLVTPMVLRVAATLRIADHIAQGTDTVASLAAATSAHTDSLDRVLRHLITVGVLTRDDSDRYTLTTRGDALRDDHPQQLRARLDIEGAIGRADLALFQLLHTVRTGDPSYLAQYGRSLWEDLSANTTLTASFDALMGSDVAREASDIVAAYDWGSCGEVVDVGGGNGALLIALLSAFPTLRGTVVDLPGAAASAQKALTVASLNDRGQAIAGSFFDPLPPGADAYLLSAIIHNWDDEPVRAILRRCAEAAGANGRVFVIERIRPDGEILSTGRDLRMLAYFGGRERSLDHVIALAADSGLHLVAVHPAGVNSIVQLATDH